MLGYHIYVHDDNTNTITTYEINDTRCTVGKLFNILGIDPDVYVLLFDDDLSLNELDKDTLLADIGLGAECTVHKWTDYNPEELKIINEYSIEALDAYNEIFSLTRSETKYNEFSDRYRGYFNCPYEFVDYCLESEEAYNNLPKFIQTSIDREYLYNIYMVDFNEENGHYFWAY